MAKEKKQRLNPADRRQLLLQAARDSLSKYGAQGAGVREICKDLNVSPGLLTHYFSGKDSLFIEAYQEMAQQYIAEIHAVISDTDISAEDRLKKLFALYFSTKWSEAGTIGTYTGFWSLSQTIPSLKTAFETTFKHQQAAFEQLVGDLVEEREISIDPKPFATFLLVFLEGVWFERCLNPNVVDKDSIQDMCWDWLECYMIAKGSARV
ncbi:TetR family transcriptional regulator (plasmid) [Parasedimentitalea marina]|uniref:TetR family transcriptional regulator n=1 Tax=Parasedimentitalea marina TaxID=2483033 RepID=A0A3T0NA89_9RHOB|nr:TetR/AcrR family transcriptional regulator [Parasedimentitalea marina]AZV80933.1 TetR family transcriptional regulator [Parasedimentitalea marina]